MTYAIFVFGLFAVSVLLTVIATVLGWLFTEYREPLFKFKPFNCRPCLTFWLSVLANAIVGLIISATLFPSLIFAAMTIYTCIGAVEGLVVYVYLSNLKNIIK